MPYDCFGVPVGVLIAGCEILSYVDSVLLISIKNVDKREKESAEL